jgi:hypothetical protein
MLVGATDLGEHGDTPSWASLMTYVIKAKIMKDHGVPVNITQFVRNMPSHVVVDLGEILTHCIQLWVYLYIQ